MNTVYLSPEFVEALGSEIVALDAAEADLNPVFEKARDRAAWYVDRVGVEQAAELWELMGGLIDLLPTAGYVDDTWPLRWAAVYVWERLSAEGPHARVVGMPPWVDFGASFFPPRSGETWESYAPVIQRQLKSKLDKLAKGVPLIRKARALDALGTEAAWGHGAPEPRQETKVARNLDSDKAAHLERIGQAFVVLADELQAVIDEPLDGPFRDEGLSMTKADGTTWGNNTKWLYLGKPILNVYYRERGSKRGEVVGAVVRELNRIKKAKEGEVGSYLAKDDTAIDPEDFDENALKRLRQWYVDGAYGRPRLAPWWETRG